MTEGPVRVRVWDWTVRVFHWSLVGLVAGMWWTADRGYMFWHKWLGVALLSLLTYRIVWGVIGPRTARLLTLIPRPGALISYVKSLTGSEHKPAFGHSALGGLAVLALLGLLIAQTVSGLFTVDVDGLNSGWFGHLISFDLGRIFADYHELIFEILLYMIGFHIIAILAYAVLLKLNLIGPMITGHRTQADASEVPESVTASPLRVACALIGAVLVAVLIVTYGR